MPELIFNPKLELILKRRRGEVVAVSTAAPVRGQPLSVVTFSRARDPAIFALLQRVAAGGDGDIEADLDPADWARLCEVGILVTEDRVPSTPRFRCPLRDPPWDLVPLRARSAAPPGAERLRVNPALRYQDEMRPPEEGRAPRQLIKKNTHPGEVNPFAEGCAWAWTSHPDAPAPSVLSIDAPDRALFRGLRPGDLEPIDLDPELRSALVRAGVLVDLTDQERRREAWIRARDDAGAMFRRDRYAVLRGLVHPAQIAALRRYYRELIAEGHVRFDDREMPLRYWAHNDPLSRYFHPRLAELVAAVVGEPVLPTFSFVASYRPGAVLTAHRDRAQCAFTISVLLDYEPEPDGLSPWPLWLGLDDDAPEGRSAAIDLGLGDALFYRGVELCHWRHALPEGHSSTSLLFHYVPADFTGQME